METRELGGKNEAFLFLHCFTWFLHGRGKWRGVWDDFFTWRFTGRPICGCLGDVEARNGVLRGLLVLIRMVGEGC